jgi:NADH-quinone oxidoreductase subunit B
VKSLLKNAQAHSLWYFNATSGSDGEELFHCLGCQYDLERFGCLPQLDPRQADLLIVGGEISQKLAPYLREVYDSMVFPKYVMVLGASAVSGGVDKILPVDIYVAGSPPRPEAIMHGLIKLQEKICGSPGN